MAINPALLIDGEWPSTIRFRHRRVVLLLLLSLPMFGADVDRQQE